MERILLTANNQAQVISQAAQVLANGGLVIYPTETVYGVGVDATNNEAVSKLLRYKNRPAGRAISILVQSIFHAEQYVEINEQAQILYKTFLPGPITVISASKHNVDYRLESELGTLGIRMSSHPIAQALVVANTFPITATSANASGKANPYTIEQILEGLSLQQLALIDLIVDAGTLPHNEPTTVIDTTTQVQEIVRGGSLLTELQPTWNTNNAEQTVIVAKELMRSLLYLLREKPVVFALEGTLGAGKTQFAKGVAEALGVTAILSSPTYTLVKEYLGRVGDTDEAVNLIHMDCWRLESPNPKELGIVSYLKPNTVLLIEWAADIVPYLREYCDDIAGYQLHFQVIDENTREIRIKEI